MSPPRYRIGSATSGFMSEAALMQRLHQVCTVHRSDLRSIVREVCEVLKTTCHQQGHKQNAPRYQNQAGSPTSGFMSEAALTELLHQVCTAATALTCTSAPTDIFIILTMKGLAFPLTTETGLCPGRRGCGGRL